MSRASPARKRRLLRYVHGYLLAHGIGPSLREMAIGADIKGLQTVSDVLDALEDDGAIRRLSGRARAIEVVSAPAIPMHAGQPLYAVPGPWDARS